VKDRDCAVRQFVEGRKTGLMSIPELWVDDDKTIKMADFCKEYGYDSDIFSDCAKGNRCKVSWRTLCEISREFVEGKQRVADGVSKALFKKIEHAVNICKPKRSLSININSRIKESAHLIDKIVRKSLEGDAQYDRINSENYYKIITDIIGVRLLSLYREDWRQVLNCLFGEGSEILEHSWKDRESHYLGKDIPASWSDASDGFLAEKPIAYIHDDEREIYEGDIFNIDTSKPYRSLHFVIKFNGIYTEIQIRTLYQQAFGEVSHDTMYPRRSVTSRLDEMGKSLFAQSYDCDRLASTIKQTHAAELNKENA
jgi:ppGpp synthetase/RelA/SpoT-type nucleotidyltranferase